MRQLLHAVMLSTTLLALSAAPSSACINDSSLKPREKEFKSDYLEQQTEFKSNYLERSADDPASTGPTTHSGKGQWPWVAGGSGVVMVIVALVLGACRSAPFSQHDEEWSR